jgi:hypothetical protein
MLGIIPTYSSNSVVPASETSSAATTTIQELETPSISYNAGNNQRETTVTSSYESSKNSPAANTHSSIPEIKATVSNSSSDASGAEDRKCPLSEFEQASGFTEIGHHFHEEFNIVPINENQQSTNNEVSISSAPDYNYYKDPKQIPTFESTVHHHQNHLQTVNQYSTNLQLLQLQLRRH